MPAENESRDGVLSSLGIGVGISVVGVFVALIPAIVGFGGAGAAACYFVAPIVAAGGVAGCTFEIDKLRDTEHYSNLGVGLLIATPGIALLVAQRRYEPPQFVDVLLALTGIGLVAFGLIGFCMGLAGIVGSRPASASAPGNEPQPPESERVSKGDRIQIWVTVISTLIASILAIVLPLIANT